MTNHDIEMMGIIGVKELCVKTGFLTPYINENDKEPSWDGEIYIYDNESKTKDYFYGKVAVQVKGVYNNDSSKKSIKFDIDVADLRAYKKIGGTLFIVTYVSSDLKKTVYYLTLPPVKLIEILKDCSNQTTKRLELKAFPSNEKKIVNLFMNFFDNCIKQRSFNDSAMISINDLNKKGIRPLTASVVGFGYEPHDYVTPFLENEIYFYYKQSDNIELPVLMTPTNITIEEPINMTVAVNGVKFYDMVKKKSTQDGTTLQIGKSISLPFIMDKDSQQLTYKMCENLNDQVIDLDFIVSVVKSNGYELNGTRIDLCITDEEYARFNIEEAAKKLDLVKRIKNVFNKLNIRKDINLNKLTKEEQNKINILLKALLNEQTVDLTNAISTFTYFNLQGIQILLYFKKIEEQEKFVYNVYDFFNSDLEFYYEDQETGRKLICPVYSLLSVKDYCKFDNINYSSIVLEYKKIYEINPNIVWRATDNMLVLLLAFDKTQDKEQLNVASDLCDWIIDIEGSDNPVNILNKLQIIKRQRTLEETEKIELIKLTEQDSVTEDIKIASYLLLDNQLAAKLHYDKLSDELKERFKHLPIYKFWQE